MLKICNVLLLMILVAGCGDGSKIIVYGDDLPLTDASLPQTDSSTVQQQDAGVPLQDKASASNVADSSVTPEQDDDTDLPGCTSKCHKKFHKKDFKHKECCEKCNVKYHNSCGCHKKHNHNNFCCH